MDATIFFELFLFAPSVLARIVTLASAPDRLEGVVFVV
jgi:hypothetical protein